MFTPFAFVKQDLLNPFIQATGGTVTTSGSLFLSNVKNLV